MGKMMKKILKIFDIDEFEDRLELNNPKYLESIKEARDQVKRGEVYGFGEVFE
jgi:PHD/YefM family antitoxin component YafN of YafNO toxin-antitoxin module